MEEGKNPYTGFIEVIKSNAREEDEKMSSFFMQAKVISGDEKAPNRIIECRGIQYKESEGEIFRLKGVTLTEGKKLLAVAVDGGESIILLGETEAV